MTAVYEFYQYRIARLHDSLAIRTTGNGGAGQRAAASLSRGGARPFTGSGRTTMLYTLQHAWGVHLSYLHI
eukprot:2349235-Pleurochrysis_carterae.AAC.1